MSSSLPRKLNLKALLGRKSFFLFGPRSVGKTTLVHQQLPDVLTFDLLDNETFAALARAPRLIGERAKDGQIVVIDEVQKLPSILDEVHRLIEKRRLRFLLTGSSARKLKRGTGVNLLGGRAWEAGLFPLVSAELPDFDLDRYLVRGGLPQVYHSEWYQEELRSYCNLYLREEIQAEALVRNIPAFARFLDTAALNNGLELNFQDLSSDSGVPPRTIDNYLTLLEDTLVGYRLPPFLATKTRKAITRSKFFFFDVGVANTLAHRGEVLRGSKQFGEVFEHFIANELRAYLSYSRSDLELCYWRSTTKFEVDLIVGRKMAIEVKASSQVTQRHLKGLRALREEGLIERYVVVSLDEHPRKTEDGIDILPWREFLAALWDDKLL